MSSAQRLGGKHGGGSLCFPEPELPTAACNPFKMDPALSVAGVPTSGTDFRETKQGEFRTISGVRPPNTNAKRNNFYCHWLGTFLPSDLIIRSEKKFGFPHIASPRELPELRPDSTHTRTCQDPGAAALSPAPSCDSTRRCTAGTCTLAYAPGHGFLQRQRIIAHALEALQANSELYRLLWE
ncbi:unnamed protein product [Boreogadus saida]